MITSTTASAFHSTLTSTPRTISSTKGSLLSKPTPMNTIQHQKVTVTNKPMTSPKVETTTVKFVPITMNLNAESKTEASNEQPIIEKIPEITTVRNIISSKLPTTTEENIKLQTFQSVQGEEFDFLNFVEQFEIN